MGRKPPTIRQHPSQQQVHTVHHQTRTIFDPEVIEHYSRIIPDAPERILCVFEKNAEAERNLQENSLRYQFMDNRRRDWMAFAIILSGLGTSAFLAWIDKPWLSGSALAAIIGYAVLGFLKKGK